GDALPSPHAAHHPATSGALRHSAAWKRVQFDAEEYHIAKRHRRAGTAAGNSDGDLGHLQGIRALYGGGALLSLTDDALGHDSATHRIALQRTASAPAGIGPARWLAPTVVHGAVR